MNKKKKKNWSNHDWKRQRNCGIENTNLNYLRILTSKYTKSTIKQLILSNNTIDIEKMKLYILDNTIKWLANIANKVYNELHTGEDKKNLSKPMC